MASAPYTIERVVNAPAEKVWNAFTDPAEMRKWYFDVSGFRPEVGNEFTFTGQKDDTVFLHLCRVTEVIPGVKISHTWRYEGHPGDSLLTIELVPEGQSTRVKLTHAGLETFTQTGDFARENFVAGWNAIIGTNLPAFVE